TQDYPIDTRDENPLMWNGVGGSSVVYTATWPRFRPSDFRKGTEHGRQPNWPIAYEDLGPWYDQHDALVGVSGLLGDPAIPPRGPFQTKPLPPGPLGEIAARGFNKLGWHFWPMPVAIIAEPFNGRPACNNCGNCQNGCPTGAMNDYSISVWPQAIAAEAELRPFARVERIETGPDGRATGVVYVDRQTGLRYAQEADVVVVAANGIGTPRLLLLSESAQHPRGLANTSDQVGRHLMHHGLALVEIWTPERTDSHQGIISALYICEEFAETDPARGFVNGVTLHITRNNGAGYQANGSHSGNIAPWGAEHHAWFRHHFGHVFNVLVVGDDLPLATNRVTLSATETDSDGLPAPHITYQLDPNDRRLVDFGIARALDLARAVDATDVKVNAFTDANGTYAPPAWHLLGTCRMGTDPATSVVNPWHQAWDVPNLYIIDGSVLPTGGAVNPTSTIGALALRAAANLRDTFAEVRTGKRAAP
ncbi:MAG: GMC family oxidoreductase, partial [Thermomicrobiales bacterium]|nr:GMC family oxidoreductase [Thermomicrobiales bacterium]